MSVDLTQEMYSTSDAARILSLNKYLLVFISENILNQNRCQVGMVRAFSCKQIQEIDAYMDGKDAQRKFRTTSPGDPNGHKRRLSNVDTITLNDVPPGEQLLSTGEAEAMLRISPILSHFLIECVLKLSRVRVAKALLLTTSQCREIDAFLTQVDPDGRWRIKKDADGSRSRKPQKVAS